MAEVCNFPKVADRCKFLKQQTDDRIINWIKRKNVPPGMGAYWAIQAGLLTPLNFARHRLSPLAAFTSGAYFLHNGMRWQWICEFYTAKVKAYSEVRSHNVSGNKQ